MSEIKLCVNCKFIDRKRNPELAKCKFPLNTRQDPVTGELSLNTTYCSTHRSIAGDRYCGSDAKWYEPKPIGFFGSLLKRFTK